MDQDFGRRRPASENANNVKAAVAMRIVIAFPRGILLYITQGVLS